jgi:molybdopterin molybdotransferase
LKQGKIYDSNSWMISSAVREMGLCVAYQRTVPDHPKRIARSIERALVMSDVIVLLGGVSVGDYDFVKDILKQKGVKTLFWRVDQKPEKPIYFGKKKNVFVFGLPGNPASSYICFYEYVFGALRRMAGFLKPELGRKRVLVKQGLRAGKRKILFFKGKIQRGSKGESVTALRHQGSHMVTTLHEADSLILVPSSRAHIKKGHSTLVDLLPYAGGDTQ